MKTFYLKQKVFSFADKYKIYSENNELKYFVKGKVFSIGDKFQFCNANEEEIFFIKRRPFSFLPRYELYKGEYLVATVVKKFTFFNHQIEISSKYGNFRVDGDYFAHEFAIHQEGTLKASIAKKWFSWGDSYEISVDENDYEFYLAIVIMIDNCIHDKKD